MQSWMALLIAAILIGPATGPAAAYASAPPVSSDVEAIADAAYEQWNSSLGIRQDCSAGATIVYESLDGRRGEYRTKTGEVVIDPTGSIAGVAAIVFHELSHHTFLACGAFADAEFTATFFASQDLPADRDWFDYTIGWSATPAEHFAEAMAITISGSGEGGIAVGAETTAAISRWLAGAPSTPPTVTYEPVPYSSGTVAAASVTVDQGGDRPAVDPKPANPVRPTSVPSTVEIYGETVEFLPASTSVFWLNSWRAIGPI